MRIAIKNGKLEYRQLNHFISLAAIDREIPFAIQNIFIINTGHRVLAIASPRPVDPSSFTAIGLPAKNILQPLVAEGLRKRKRPAGGRKRLAGERKRSAGERKRVAGGRKRPAVAGMTLAGQGSAISAKGKLLTPIGKTIAGKGCGISAKGMAPIVQGKTIATKSSCIALTGSSINGRRNPLKHRKTQPVSQIHI